MPPGQERHQCEDMKVTYSHAAQLLFHLVQFLLLTGCREKSCGIATFHSIHLNWGLKEIHFKRTVRQRAFDWPNKKVHKHLTA